MRHSITWLSWLVLLLACGAWGAYVYGTFLLAAERDAYAAALEQKGQDAVREEVQSRLRATVRDTETERALLHSVVAYPIVNAVEAIESAGRSAGVKTITISQAYPQQLAAKDLSAVLITLQADGTFASLVRAVSLFETLPLPTVVENVQLEHQKDAWVLNARVKVILATQTL